MQREMLDERVITHDICFSSFATKELGLAFSAGLSVSKVLTSMRIAKLKLSIQGPDNSTSIWDR